MKLSVWLVATVRSGPTVKLDELAALPPSPWTVIEPDVAAAGTVAVIWAGEVMV